MSEKETISLKELLEAERITGFEPKDAPYKEEIIQHGEECLIAPTDISFEVGNKGRDFYPSKPIEKLVHTGLGLPTIEHHTVSFYVGNHHYTIYRLPGGESHTRRITTTKTEIDFSRPQKEV